MGGKVSPGPQACFNPLRAIACDVERVRIGHPRLGPSPRHAGFSGSQSQQYPITRPAAPLLCESGLPAAGIAASNNAAARSALGKLDGAQRILSECTRPFLCWFLQRAHDESVTLVVATALWQTHKHDGLTRELQQNLNSSE